MNCTILLRLGTKVNWLDFEIKRSKFRVIVRPNIVKKVEADASVKLC